MTKSSPKLPFVTPSEARFQGNMRHYHRASQQVAPVSTMEHTHRRHRHEASRFLKRAGLILGALAFIGILCAVTIALSP